MKSISKRIFIIAFLIGGIALMLNGGYIHVKAMLGQWLISKAWQESHHREQVRPWPWMDTWPTAKLILPTLAVEQIILEGDSGQALAFGPAHRTGSASPGESGTVLISGHRDTHFSFLNDLRIGDPVKLEDRKGKTFHYEIEQFQIVDADDVLLSRQNERLLVLATCWPVGSLQTSTQRLIVIARQRQNEYTETFPELLQAAERW
jgi:sortase A